MALDPSIPLSAAQQPSFAQNAGQVYQLAGAIEKQKEMQQQRQDQQAIQGYLKEGGNFNTPDGLAQAAEKLKGVVSPQAYQTLSQAQSEMKTNEAKMQEYYAKMGPEVIENQMKQQDFIAQSLETPITAYKQALAEKKTPQEAQQAYEAAKAQINQQIENMPQVGGKPAFDPAMRQRFMSMSPAEAESALKSTRYYKDQMKAGLDLQLKQAQIGAEKALEEERKANAKAKREGSEAGGDPFVGLVTSGENTGIKNLRPALVATQKEYPWLTLAEVGEKKASAEGIRKSINQQRSAIGKLEGFERTALANIDMLAKEMKDIRSKQAVDLPLANRFLSFVKQQAGIPYDQAVGMYGREIAAELTKLASSATASGTGGTLSDREEWNKFFEKGASFDQMMKSLDAARNSASARIKSSHDAIALNEDEIKNLWKKPGEKTLPEEVPQSQLKKAGASAVPKGLPEGSKQIGHTPDGKPVWQSPDGKKYVE
jgi:hypothetical protein